MLSNRRAALQVAVLGVSAIVGAWSARADDRTGYAALSGGYAIPSGSVDMSNIATNEGIPLPDSSVSLDDGWDVSLGLGLYVAKHCRAEFQYTAQANKVSSVDVPGSSTSSDANFWSNLFMVNGYYDIPLADHWSLYVGGGIGALYATWSGHFTTDAMEVTVRNSNGVGFAYQVMAGVAYEITPTFTLTLGYRGWSSTTVSTSNNDSSIPWSNVIEAGLRVSF